MSERVIKPTEERLNEWKEIYDIPNHLEFDYKALAQLEFQYEEMSEKSPEHVRTRSELLRMIKELKSRIPFPKKEYAMYVDTTRDKGTSVYVNGNGYGISNRHNYNETALYIKSIMKQNNVSKIFLDFNGAGMGIKDALELMDIKAEKLIINRIK